MNAQPVTHSSSLLRQAMRRLLLPAGALGMPALALAGGPTGEVIVAGDGTVSRPDTNTTVIDQASWRAIVDWQSFNIGLDEYVIFNQPGANAVILNRVVGGDPTSILGSMTANGQVFLVNPQGVFFGQTATLDVGGLLATTLDISNENFMAGNYSFAKTGGAPDAGVMNEGNITADGGYVVLAADHVSNGGVIAARAGHVVMAAGSALTLDIEGDGLVNFAVDEAALSEMAGVSNAGTILADGGTVLMTAKVANDLVATAVNNEGLIQAHSISEQDGVIYLAAEGGDIVNAGTLDADGTNGNSGGVVYLHGNENIDLKNGSVITASGNNDAAGGMVRVIAEDTLWFREAATIDVTGSEGQGGFVEVSGYEGLLLRGQANIGSGGTFLIDPSVLTIRTGTNGGAFTGSTASGSLASVGSAYITTQLGLNVNVYLVASDSVTASSGVTALNATGTGDLFVGIGSITGATGSVCAFGVCAGIGTPTFNGGTSGNINLAGVDISIGGDFTVGGSAASAPIVSLGDVSAANVSILSTSLNMGQIIAAGNVTITGDGGAFMQFDGGATGSIAISAGNNININGAGTLRLGDGAFGDGAWIGQAVNAGGNISINAARVVSGEMTATTGNIVITASDGQIFFGSATSSGAFTFANVNAGGAVQLTATGNGSAVSIQAGNITAKSVDVQATNSDSYGGNAVIRAGDVTANTGLIRLMAQYNGAGSFNTAAASIDAGKLTAATTITVEAIADTGTPIGGHIVTGALSANEIFVRHNGNKADITLGSIAASNSTGRALVDVVTGDGSGVTQAGNITVNGDITVAGQADSACTSLGGCMGAFNQPIAAHVQLRAGGSGSSVLPGTINITGNVSITATPASVTATRSGDGLVTSVTGTAGLAELFMSGAAADIGGSLMVQGADALVQVQADTVSFGTVQITGTGHNITLFDDPDTLTTGSSLTSSNNAGNAMLRIVGRGTSSTGEAAASSVSLGNVTITGKGEASLRIAALNTALGSVAVSAAAATYTRTITGNYTDNNGDFDNAAFNNNGGNDSLNLDQGTVTIGAGTIRIYGGTTCVSSSCTENPAQALAVTGNLSATGVGEAQISAFATNINITGNITATATTGNVVNGVGSSFYSGTGASTTGIYNVATTASGSFGSAEIHLQTDAGSGASITVGGSASVSGPGADFTAESKGTVTLGAITVSNTGYNYSETNLYTLSGTPTGSTLTSFTSSFQGMQVDDGALAQITGTTVNMNGPVAMTGVGVSGVLIEGTSVAVQGVSVTTTALTSTTTLDTRISPTANTVQRGDAVFGITNMDGSGAPIAGATMTGNVTVDGVQNANIGINGAISGVLNVQAGTGDIDTLMPAYFADSGSPPSLPPLNASANAMVFNAGGNILLSGSTLTIGSGSAGVPADTAVATAAGIGASPVNGAFAAGGTLDLGNLNLSGNYLWLIANNFGVIGTVTIPTTTLVQFTTFDPTRTLGLDLGTGGTAQTTLTEAYVAAFNGANYLAFGDSTHTGDLLLGETGAVNLATEQLIFATTGNITGANTVSATKVNFLTGAISNIAANLNTGIVNVAAGNDVSLTHNGPAIFTFGSDTYGNVSLVTTGDLTLQSGITATEILLQADAGGVVLGTNTLTASNGIILDVDTTFSGTGLLTANSLNLLGATSTDFNIIANVVNFNITGGNNFTLDNTIRTGTATLTFGAGPFGLFDGAFGGTVIQSGSFAGSGFDLTVAGDFTFGGNTINVGSGMITLDIAGALASGTGLLTAGNLILIGGTTTDFDLLGNVAVINAQNGNDITIDNTAHTGAATLGFGAGPFGIVDLTTGGNLTLVSTLTAADITLRGLSGLDLGANTLTATNNILLDTGGIFSGTGLLTANTLNLIGGATTDFNVTTNAGAITAQSGNDFTINNTAHTGAATLGFGTGPFGLFDGAFGGDATLVNGFTGTGFELTTAGALTTGANNIDVGSGSITLDIAGALASGTGLLTANSLNLIGAATTDFNLLTNVTLLNAQSGNDITLDNSANSGAATIVFGPSSFGIVDVTHDGVLSLGAGLNASDVTLRGIGGLNFGANFITATNSILLDTGGIFSGTGLLTANTLNLIGGATTDFNVTTNAGAITAQSGNDFTINNTAHTGAATLGFGTGPFGLFDGAFGGDATLVNGFTGTGFELTTAGALTTGANNINVGSGSIDLTLGGAYTGTGLWTASDFVLIGETNTDYVFNTKAGWISIQSAGGITVDNTAHTGSAYVSFGSDTFTDVAFTMGGNTNIGGASSLTANNATIVVNNGGLDISNNTFNIASDLGLSADNNIVISGAVITAGNLLMVAGSDITDAGSGSQGGLKQGSQGATTQASTSITADAMTLLAGGDILLGQTTFTIGSGDMSALTTIGGDTELLTQLDEEGIVPASSAPNAALIAQGSVQIGAMSVAGGYLYLEASDIGLNGAITGPSNLLVQLVPFAGIGTIGLENTAGTADTINLGGADVGLIQDGATLALGSSAYQGNVTLGLAGPVDVGARNFVVATTGTVDSLANITSTGLVASLEELVSGPDIFDEPTLEEIDADYNSNPSDSDDEEGEEEGEDTDDDGTPDSEGGNALIQHDSSGETKVCAG